MPVLPARVASSVTFVECGFRTATLAAASDPAHTAAVTYGDVTRRPAAIDVFGLGRMMEVYDEDLAHAHVFSSMDGALISWGEPSRRVTCRLESRPRKPRACSRLPDPVDRQAH
jgi:hypothetical protein